MTSTTLLISPQVRKEHFGYGINKKSLRTIEKAAFVLILDDTSHEVSDQDAVGLTGMGRSLLHGKCNDRYRLCYDHLKILNDQIMAVLND